METFLLLTLLLLSEKNPSLHDALQNVLKIYRENRDLFFLLSNPAGTACRTIPQSGNPKGPSQTSAAPDSACEPPQNEAKKSASTDQEAGIKLIEEFLKRQKF